MKIAVLGAGGWGTALASILSVNHECVVLWAHNPAIAEEINTHRTNQTYLPGISIPEGIIATNAVGALTGAEIFVLTVPTQHIRTTLADYDFPLYESIIVSGSKGIERGTLLRVSDIVREAAGVGADRFVALTGPSHAEEAANRIPTTVLAASADTNVAQHIQKVFSTPTFRVYSSGDVVGAELGGALKNVIAISAGIIDGLEFGDNTKAALMTRGLVEITRLGVAMGADPLTFSGLSGLGDLIVTCRSRHSRNRWVGEQIGRGKTLEEILRETKKVAEGVPTTVSALALSKKYEVEMPIVSQVHEVLFGNKDPREAIQELMVRQSKPELWG